MRNTHHTTTIDRTSLHSHAASRRTRLGFASGVAAALVAGIAFAATTTSAAPVANESTYVPIAPCRLLDTRPGPDQIGPRATPIGQGDTMTQQVTGTNGNCTIPSDATAVALNATHDNATGNSYVTFHPADTPLPLSSNLNFLPGQAPTPNKVDVKLSTDGKLKIYNNMGNVDMIVDVTGYYTGTTLDDTEDRLTQLRNDVDDIVDELDLASFHQPFSVTAETDFLQVGNTDTTVVELSITPPVGGTFVVNSSSEWTTDVDGQVLVCSISSTNQISASYTQRFQTTGDGPVYWGHLAGTRRFTIPTGGLFTARLVCEGDVQWDNQGAVLTGMFFPNS